MIPRILLTALFTLPLSGCLGDLIEWSCIFDAEDPDHCYQAAAVQNADPDDCENVKGAGFSGSNPPKDKCNLMIAENTGDLSACDNMVGGFMSYDPDECVRNVLANYGPEACEKAVDPMACREAYAARGRGCGPGYHFVQGSCEEAKEETSDESPPTDDATERGLSDAEKEDLNTIADAAKGKYMELLEADIENETDPGKLAGLEAYKEWLEKAGETIETAQATFETLSEFKKLFVDSYDSANDIENMSVSPLLDSGLFDKIKERLLGADKLEGLDRENADAENSLKVYEAMLKQQEENDFVKKGRLERIGSTIASKLKDAGVEHVTDAAKEIAEDVAGTALGAVTQVGEALEAFKDEAQHQMFLGLARAYNRRREALEQQFPNMSSEDVHARAVEQVKDDPYRDNTQLAVVKHGNILENQDCQDGSNPLCIDNRVWWTAMGKTFEYNKRNR